MLLPIRLNSVNSSELQPGTTALLGTTRKVNLPRVWGLEEILVFVSFTTDSTAPTAGTSPDKWLNLLKRVNLSINDGIQPRTVVDFTGPGLLEYAVSAGLNLDAATLAVCNAAPLASTTYRICYRIPLVHPMVGEPLRTRMLLPIHNHPQDPILTLEFATAAEVYAANAPTLVTSEVVLVQREINPLHPYNAKVMNEGGFIPFDLMETPFTIGTGVSGEQRFSIPTPGAYANLLCRQYLGGSTVTRAVLDATTTIGSETKWRLETGGTVIREWRWKYLQAINEFSKPLTGLGQAYSSIFTGASNGGSATVTTVYQANNPRPGSYTLASGTAFMPAATAMLDFLTDGLDSATELGSLLDCNVPFNQGLKMELIGSVASVATNASTLYIGGHRYYGDLSRWKAIK